MCKVFSESGKPCGFEPCEAYIKLLSEKSRLEGRCAGLELGNKINLESIKRQDERMVELLKENESLRAEVEKHKDRRQHFEDLLNCSIEHENEWTRRALKAEAENATLRQDRDRLAGIVEKADALYQASKIQCFRKEFEKAQDAYQEARHG